MTACISCRVGDIEDARFTAKVCRHSGALPHGSAAGHGFGAASALPATSELTDKRSPRGERSEGVQQERPAGAYAAGGIPIPEAVAWNLPGPGRRSGTDRSMFHDAAGG